MNSLAPLTPGTVTLVGGGPGDPGLMTVAGRAAVEQADVLLRRAGLSLDHAVTTSPISRPYARPRPR